MNKLRPFKASTPIKVIAVLFVTATPQEAMSNLYLETLCTEQEDIYFSCKLDNGKIVSLCAKDNHSPQHGYVQYRYGTEHTIELTYPKHKQPPKNNFLIVDATEGSVPLALIRFKRSNYSYRISESFSNYLTVLKDGAEVFRHACDPGQHSSIDLKADAGLKQGEVIDEDLWWSSKVRSSNVRTMK